MSDVPQRRPNIVVILADDMGFSDLGCFGGEIATPNLDRIGRQGLRASNCYNTARCSPSRASLLTGRHPHETGVGVLNGNMTAHGGYPGTLSRDFPTIAERLKAAGYRTGISGKWHLSSSINEPDESWPTRRGFDEFYGITAGADSYYHPGSLWHNETKMETPTTGFYLTDAISDHASQFVRDSDSNPFFLYLAYTAPHWPLHADEEFVTPYEDRYRKGWDLLRQERYERLRGEGILDDSAALSDRDPTQPAWDEVAFPDFEARRMAVYAAQLEILDRGVGRVLDALEETGVLDDTLVMFLSDNGACAEGMPPGQSPQFLRRYSRDTPDGMPLMLGNTPDIWPGPRNTYSSYGQAWANLSNVPFRLYKRWVHEGGIATSFIASWPAGSLADGSVLHEPFQLTDITPTILDAAGVEDRDRVVGTSMLPSFREAGSPDFVPAEHTLFWEHIGNAAARRGDWKIVRISDQPWELYNLGVDRSELHDLADQHPELVAELADAWQEWADRVGVIPWNRLKEVLNTHGG